MLKENIALTEIGDSLWINQVLQYLI